MSLDDDIKQALHRHESDVQTQPGAWRDVERSVTRSHRARVALSSTLAVAAIAAIAVVVPRLGSSQHPAPNLTLPPSETPSSSPSTSPLTPTLLAKIGVRASKLAAGGDSIWALDASGDHGTLIRINGATNDVSARIPVGVKPHALAALADQVWVANDTNVMRIDPATDRVVATIDVQTPGDVAATSDGVWVVRVGGSSTSLLRIDPTTNTIDKTYALKDASGLVSVTVGEGYVWVAESTASPHDLAAPQTWALQRLDPTTGDIRTAAFDQFGNPMIDVTTTPGAVWVSTTGTTSASAIDRFDPDTMQLAARFELPDASPVGGPNAIAAGEGFLWAVGERGQFWKVDSTANKPLTKLDVGEAPPISAPDVVTGFGAVWIASDDGHIWKFAP